MEESDKHNRLHIQLSSLGHSYLQIESCSSDSIGLSYVSDSNCFIVLQIVACGFEDYKLENLKMDF